MLTTDVQAESGYFESLRRREFARVDAQDLAYLDYTGSALYPDSIVRGHTDRLRRRVFGNPHSTHAPSLASTDAIDAARAAVLGFFDADPTIYDVCFTANTSAAVKLIGESYPFAADRGCVLTADNHNSINGLREYARRAGARARYIALDDNLRLRDPTEALSEGASRGAGLFAFPAQSNFSGIRHSLGLIDTAQRLGFDVLVDAAAYAGTHALSLRETPADALVASCYKISGYPTGVGMLVIRRTLLERLRRPWFAGGTVEYVSVQLDRHVVRTGHDGVEDGTPNFLDLAAVAPALAWVSGVNLGRVETHIAGLRQRLTEGLRALQHANGLPRVVVYGPADSTDRGGTIALNVLAHDGQVVPYDLVLDHAIARGVACRGGCFCNPGASEAAFGFGVEESARCFDALGDGFSIPRFAACMGAGVAVGAVRMSLGLANNTRDVDRAVEAIASFRHPAGS